MSHFVDKKLIPITEGGDTVWILPKLSFGARNAAQDALIRAELQPDGTLKQGVAVGAYTQELLCQAIVKWSGPGWDGVECTREAILALDYEDPLFVKVQEEVNRRNTSAGGGDPKLPPPPAPASSDAGAPDWTVVDVPPIPSAAAA